MRCFIWNLKFSSNILYIITGLSTFKYVWLHLKNVTSWFQDIFFVNLRNYYSSFDYLEISSLWIFASTSPVVTICNFSQCYLINSQIYQCLTLTQFHLTTNILNFEFFFLHFFFQTLDMHISNSNNEIMISSLNLRGFFLIGSNNWGKFQRDLRWQTKDFAQIGIKETIL